MKNDQKLPLGIIHAWFRVTNRKIRGFHVSEEMMPQLHEVLSFSKDEATRISTVLANQKAWRLIPCKDIERILFTNNKMF